MTLHFPKSKSKECQNCKFVNGGIIYTNEKGNCRDCGRSVTPIKTCDLCHCGKNGHALGSINCPVHGDKVEKIVSAAIWYKDQPKAHYLPVNVDRGVVIGGLRHPHCMYTFIALTGKKSIEPEAGGMVQGFITSYNRFVDREEAMHIHKKTVGVSFAGIYFNEDILFSEDLY